MDLGFDTIGNATLIAYDRSAVLVTDPWIDGSAYFGSWTLPFEIPEQQHLAVVSARFCWLSHGHPDHLSLESLAHLKHQTLLLPDHVGGRIAADLRTEGFNVRVLPERRWIPLSDRIRVWSLGDVNQDGILLIDIDGTVVANLNDAFDNGWRRAVTQQLRTFDRSVLLAAAGYGDADMLNFWDETGQRIEPDPLKLRPFGARVARRAAGFGCRFTAPFSHLHAYQRSDSAWANKWVTPPGAHAAGFESNDVELLPAFVRYDLAKDHAQALEPAHKPVELLDPSAFGDHWDAPFEPGDADALDAYFGRFEVLSDAIDAVHFKVGGTRHTVAFSGSRTGRELTFATPRKSLMEAVKYEVFDDLLIGNFTRTTLHGPWSADGLYPDFSPVVAKYGDNGRAHSREQLEQYFEAYRRRAGWDWFRWRLESGAKHQLRRFAQPGSRPWAWARKLYWTVRR